MHLHLKGGKSSLQPFENPYWEAIKGLVTDTRSIPREYDDLRWPYCNQYTMAIPDPETVAFVARHLAPYAVEVGAGTGYWAWLLGQLGIDIVAYDTAPPDRCTTNSHHSPYDVEACVFLGLLRETYAPVQVGGPEVLSQHTARTLFLCWPPYRSAMALRCLECYAGQKLVYLGEGWGDSCATDAFFDRLRRDWREVECHWPVHWYRLNDRVIVYERKR
jgi:hypothetical protein